MPATTRARYPDPPVNREQARRDEKDRAWLLVLHVLLIRSGRAIGVPVNVDSRFMPTGIWRTKLRG